MRRSIPYMHWLDLSKNVVEARGLDGDDIIGFSGVT